MEFKLKEPDYAAEEFQQLRRLDYEKYAAMPIRAIFPCRVGGKDCIFLEKTEHAEYHKCVYHPPKVPRAYWQYHVPYKEQSQWRNTKYLEGNGPFTDDAERVKCEVFQLPDDTDVLGAKV